MSVCAQLTASQAIIIIIIGCCHFHRKCGNYMATIAGGEVIALD